MTACAIPFCKRQRQGDPANWWICGRHWPLVSRRTKQRLRAAHRAWTKGDDLTRPIHFRWLQRESLNCMFEAIMGDAFGWVRR